MTTPKIGKLIIFSAPSGSGKSTIVGHLLQKNFNLEFSVSATSRAPRGAEVNGRDYYFLSADEFRAKIENQEFLEWEEVYADTYYGTLRSEVDRITQQGKNIVFDVDVVGGANIKKMYGNRALALFIQPPSIDELEQRLKNRGTDSPDKIAMRLAKASEELTWAPRFDVVLVNDDLDKAKQEAEKILTNFLSQS
ncbi:guanylate kinase [Breznakibacter xylanolyticus]|uniref:Guanylate kinase n=1 Tax=Breznakibacter xylanolyticus TaxID=990 RepID=A0A2W7N529_9BACT|nr:guanylate kinase [Breznakibacter xylanolyticus]MBN2743616.1 guanylate kinase [Marinilabiliaceae bacterium]PZX15170.1 guanylate kinase [Breznakibacter xylanolyticus]